MNRFSRLLGEFSRNSQRAKLTQQLNKKVEAPEANANWHLLLEPRLFY